jgi:amidase/aspartyl-tRNA(Asn)/glutamyl-tRNA(Gln) amidotransferase subunit A
VTTDELAYMSAASLALRIRRRELSPVEVIEAFIARIEVRNPSLNALVYLGFEDARRAAREAERALMSGAALGPLHGVPVALKDNFDFKPGWIATIGGVRALKDHVSHGWCVFAERIERAGAILLGKTNSPTLGFRGTCDNYLFGPSRNPFNLAGNTGGSSGGSAGAVADGLLPLAEGTDGGGSIRIPSSWCGVYGYKASFGGVPTVVRPNAFGGTNPFVFEGPITRTVEDAALAMTALAGRDSRDPFSLDETIDFLAATRRSLRGWKIAWSPNLDVFPVDPEVAAVVERAVRAFAEAGAEIEEVKIGIKRSQQELSALWCRICMLGELQALEDLRSEGIDLLQDHRDDLPPLFLHWAEISAAMSAMDLMRDNAVRTEVYDAISSVLDRYDLLVTPTLACVAVDNAGDGDTVGPRSINGEAVDPLIGWCLTYPINFTGHPAASVPAGLWAGRLPIGMQIVGRRYADADVLAASAAFERLRPWQDSYRLCEARPLSRV